MTNQSKVLLLVGLLVVWAGVTFFQLSEVTETSSRGTSSIPPLSGATLPPTKDLLLAKTFTNTRQDVPFTPPRNIFAPLGFQPAPPPKTSSQAAPSTTPTTRMPPTPPPGPSPEELAAQRAREQLKKFRFLGYLTKGGESQAFLTNGQAIFIVKQGEMMEGKVQVHKIEPENIVLSTKIWETGNHIQATIPLTPESRG